MVGTTVETFVGFRDKKKPNQHVRSSSCLKEPTFKLAVYFCLSFNWHLARACRRRHRHYGLVLLITAITVVVHVRRKGILHVIARFRRRRRRRRLDEVGHPHSPSFYYYS